MNNVVGQAVDEFQSAAGKMGASYSSMRESHTTLASTASKKPKNAMPLDTEANQEKIVDLMQRVG